MKIKQVLYNTVKDLIELKGVDTFYIGNNGNFDIMAKHIIEELSKQYKINYYIVLSYMPQKRKKKKTVIRYCLRG